MIGKSPRPSPRALKGASLRAIEAYWLPGSAFDGCEASSDATSNVVVQGVLALTEGQAAVGGACCCANAGTGVPGAREDGKRRPASKLAGGNASVVHFGRGGVGESGGLGDGSAGGIAIAEADGASASGI